MLSTGLLHPRQMTFSHTWGMHRPVLPQPGSPAESPTAAGLAPEKPGQAATAVSEHSAKTAPSFLYRQGLFAACWGMNQGKEGRGARIRASWAARPHVRTEPLPSLAAPPSTMLKPALAAAFLAVRGGAGIESFAEGRKQGTAGRAGAIRAGKEGAVHCRDASLGFSEAPAGARDPNSPRRGLWEWGPPGKQTPLGPGGGHREGGGWRPLCKSLAIPAPPTTADALGLP